MDYLTKMGFIASWENQGGKWFIHASNCPWQNVAVEHPEICQMDQFILENLMGARVVSLQRIVEGSHTCIYQVSNNSSSQATR